MNFFELNPKASWKNIRNLLFNAADYKWLFLFGYYFWFDLGQEQFNVGSFERVDFYSIHLASFFVLLSIYLSVDGLRIMPRSAVYVIKVLVPYFIWDLWDNIQNEGDRILQSEFMLTSAIVFFLMIGDLIWGEFFKHTLSKTLIIWITGLVRL